MNTDWRASLVPAAAVIPAPTVYIKVAVVKMLVVQILQRAGGPPSGWVHSCLFAYWWIVPLRLTVPCARFMQFTLRKLECSEHACALNTIALDNINGSPLELIGFGLRYWAIGIIGGIRIQQSEVKFLDLLKSNCCESICQSCFHWSRTKAKGSKTIRYRPSLSYKKCRLEGDGRQLEYFVSGLWQIKVYGFRGGVWSQGWNLTELTEGHHQEWSLRLNLTQHGKTHQVQT